MFRSPTFLMPRVDIPNVVAVEREFRKLLRRVASLAPQLPDLSVEHHEPVDLGHAVIAYFEWCTLS
jgi:hypothetical protein